MREGPSRNRSATYLPASTLCDKENTGQVSAHTRTQPMAFAHTRRAHRAVTVSRLNSLKAIQVHELESTAT